MKKTVLTKSVLRVLPLGLFFTVMGLASCNSELNMGNGLSLDYSSPTDSLAETGIQDCYSAGVIFAAKNNDTIKAFIRIAPEGLSGNQTSEGQYAKLLKSDLQYLEMQKGDTIDFKITHFKEISIFEILPAFTCDKVYKAFFCRVKPCE